MTLNEVWIGDLIVRELTNGVWFFLNLFLVFITAHYLIYELIHTPKRKGTMWVVRAWMNMYNDRGTQAAFALFIYFIGASIRSGYIWVMFLNINKEWGYQQISERGEVLILAAIFVIGGSLCCVRVFSHDWKSWVWITAGTTSVATPVIIHIFL